MKYQSEKEFLLDAIAYQDGSLDSSRIDDFEEALQSSKRMREAYIRLQLRSSQYIEIQRRQALTSSPSLQPTRRVRSVGRPWFTFAWAGLVAASIAIFLTLGPFRAEGELDGILITRAHLVTWEGQAPRSERLIEQNETYRLQAGAVRMRMPGGAIVSIVGPATFTALSDDTIDLSEGKIAARLPSEESSLVVITNGMVVTDLGTAFGVSATPDGESSISVFEGEVRLESVESSPASAIILTAGGSVLADGYAQVPIDQEMFDSTRYQDVWPLTAGVDEVSSLLEFVPPGPIKDLEFFQHDQKLFILPEQLDVSLTQAIAIDHAPGDKAWNASSDNPSELSAGSSLRSYLLFFNPRSVLQDQFHRLRGSVAFSRPIAGLIFESEKLEATDALLGLETLKYKKRKARGLEQGLDHENEPGRDTIGFSKDGRELYFDLNAGRAIDSFRVLVSAE